MKVNEGDRVELLHDITTRGGRVFRKGVVMVVRYTSGGYNLSCRVRGRWHTLRLEKKRAEFWIKVLPKEGNENSVKK